MTTAIPMVRASFASVATVRRASVTLLLAALAVAIAPCRGGNLRSRQFFGAERQLATNETVLPVVSEQPCGDDDEFEAITAT